MVYIIGVVGFLGGFVFGQCALYFMLKDKSKEELLGNKSLQFKYGLLNWVFAILGCLASIEIYKQYFM